MIKLNKNKINSINVSNQKRKNLLPLDVNILILLGLFGQHWLLISKTVHEIRSFIAISNSFFLDYLVSGNIIVFVSTQEKGSKRTNRNDSK